MSQKPYRLLIFALLTCSQSVAFAETDNAKNAAPASIATRGVPESTVKVEAVPPTSQTIWDVMAKVNAENERQAALAAQKAAEPKRLPLGPFQSFTLPENPNGASLSEEKKHLGPGGFLGDIDKFFQRLGKETGSSVKIRGHSTFTFQDSNTSSSSPAGQAYQSQFYNGAGSNGIYNDTDIDLDATLFHSLTYKTHFSNYLYGTPGQNRFDLDYHTPTLRIQAGDINANLQGNSLIAFSRYLTGVEATDVFNKRFSATVLASETNATPHTLVIPGNNTSGPYYLFAGQIVNGSAQVRVDNQNLEQGKDYTLDPLTGELNFLNNRVVLATSSIAVTFETLGYNQNPGTIYGVSTNYLVHPGTQIGFTYLTQITQGSGIPSQQTQQFYGNSTPLSPYILDYPVNSAFPVSVKVNGAPLIQGVAFTVDSSFPDEIRLVQGVPGTETVTIEYTPLNTNPTPGNRSVVGLNSTIGLGNLGNVTLESAFSGLSIAGQGVNGQALQMRSDLHPAKHLNTTLTIRDIGPSFTAIESPGFNQNEKSIAFTSDYTPSSRLHLDMNYEYAKRPSYQSVSSTTSTTLPSTTVGNDTYHQYGLDLNYNLSKNGTISLSRNSIDTQYIVGGNSGNLTDSLSLHYTFGTLGLQAGVSHNVSNSTTFYNTGITTSSPTGGTGPLIYDANTLSTQFGLNWTPKSWVQLNANFTNNSITSSGNSTQAGKSDAKSAQVGANFRLGRGLRINYTYSLSNSGSGYSSTSTGTTGSNVGSIGSSLGGNGLLGGGTNGGLGVGNYGGLLGGTGVTGLTSLNGESQTQQIAVSYTASKTLQLSTGLLLSSSVGSYQYNSTSRDINLTANWQPKGGMLFSATFDLQHSAYSGQVGGADVSTMDFNASGHPFHSKLRLDFGYLVVHNVSAFSNSAVSTGASGSSGTSGGVTSTGTTGSTGTSGSTTNTSNDTTSLSLRLEYPIAPRYSVFMNYSDTLTAGYLGSSQSDISTGLNYLIGANIKFSLGWQIATSVNSSTSQASYNYHVSTLLAQLGFDF